MIGGEINKVVSRLSQMPLIPSIPPMLSLPLMPPIPLVHILSRISLNRVSAILRATPRMLVRD